MPAVVFVGRFAMKRGAIPCTKAFASAGIAGKLRGLVSFRFSPFQPAPCVSVVRRNTPSRSPYVARTRYAITARRAEGLYSAELSAQTASTRSTRARSMSLRSFIQQSRFSHATGRSGSRCPRASLYSRRCPGRNRCAPGGRLSGIPDTARRLVEQRMPLGQLMRIPSR